MNIDITNFPASGIQCLQDLMDAGYEAFFVGGCVRGCSKCKEIG